MTNILYFALIGLGSGILAGVILVLIIQYRKSKKVHHGQFNTSFVFSGNLKQTTLLDAILNMQASFHQMNIYAASSSIVLLLFAIDKKSNGSGRRQKSLGNITHYRTNLSHAR
jgi:hypothetical protein